jgi:hypothetical protein
MQIELYLKKAKLPSGAVDNLVPGLNKIFLFDRIKHVGYDSMTGNKAARILACPC